MKVGVAFAGRVVLLVVGVGSAVIVMLLTTPEPQAQASCRLVGAQTCSNAQTQCFRVIRERFGQKAQRKWCSDLFPGCLATGTWKGPTCNLEGLRKE
jgi:hypothetical protein